MLRERDEGFIQLTQATSANPNAPEDLEFKLRLAEVAQRPIIDNVVPVSQKNPRTHQERLEWLAAAQEQGLQIFGQGATIRTGFAFSLDNWNLYDASPAWREATTGTLEDKIRKMKDPAIREAIKRETETANTLFTQTQIAVGGPAHKLVVQHITGRPGPQRQATRARACARSPTRRASTTST